MIARRFFFGHPFDIQQVINACSASPIAQIPLARTMPDVVHAFHIRRSSPAVLIEHFSQRNRLGQQHLWRDYALVVLIGPSIWASLP